MLMWWSVAATTHRLRFAPLPSTPHLSALRLGNRRVGIDGVGLGRFGYVIDPDFSCDCPITDEEYDVLQQRADVIGVERD